MARSLGPELLGIARLRSLVATLARGGEYRAAALALQDLARRDKRAGLAADAIKRAWQAAALTRIEGSATERGAALVHLAGLLLEAGDTDGAAAAATLGTEELGAAEGKDALLVRGGAALLVALAAAASGDDERARQLLHTARERLVSAGRPGTAAFALAALGELDLADGDTAGADVCFRFAREMERLRGDDPPVDEQGLAGLAARRFAEAGYPSEALRWGELALGDAEEAKDARRAALVAAELAAVAEQHGDPADARALARRAAGLADRAPLDAEVAAARLAARLRLARLAPSGDEALRHLEAAFELALTARDEATIGALVDITAAGAAEQALPPAARDRLARFEAALRRAGLTARAEEAAAALAALR